MIFTVIGAVILTSGTCVSMMYYAICKIVLWTLYKTLCAHFVDLL